MSTLLSSNIIMRPYAGEADLPAIACLMNACEAVDRADIGTSVDELRQEFAHPNLDAARNISLWQRNDGTLIGFGALSIPQPTETHSGFLNFHVHPIARNSDIETQIFAWGEQQLRAVGGSALLELQAVSRPNQGDRPRLLERYGFTAKRYFFQMARSLAEPIPTPQFPVGFTLRHVVSELDAADWVALFNESFIDHWNHHPMTVEQFHYHNQDPDYDPALDLVAIAPDGTFAAFCTGCIYPNDNQRSGRNEGWIEVLGTRRGFRRLGLGRAMLLLYLQQLRSIGAETALLGVDSDNPSGALRLYESVGFRQLHTTIVYTKEVRSEGVEG
ncbi:MULTISPECIES: GNAT family N-acetyltransferase [Cyanophyceae]|uniref:GNAT family N-acetyltransferase n=1 Tax=Stenomitos frigidus AS-A4 TaxID=2933935 RepID=A0ABV0KFP3_9CYAN